MGEDCIFCKIAKGEISCKKVFESKNFIGFLDINPFTEGHTLIIPKNHFSDFLDLPEDLYVEFIDSLKQVSKQIMLKEGVGGFNLLQNNGIVAQQEVSHFHFHIIPRRKEDNKNFKFC